MGFPQDVVALIVLFVILFILFIVFRIGASAEQRSVDDINDITFGNYMAHVYLRTPVGVGDMTYSMAELIAIYDHQQGGDAGGDCEEGEECGRGVGDVLASLINNAWNFVIGEPSPLRGSIVNLTNGYVMDNFPEDKCYYFAVHGSNFDYNIKGTSCRTAQTFSIYFLMSELDEIPDEVYKTYVAPVDPRDPPIEVYSIVDFERLIAIYTGDEFASGSELERFGIYAMCRTLPVLPMCLERSLAAAEAQGTEIGTALGKGIRRATQ